MPLQVRAKSFLEDSSTRVFRVLESDIHSYFDVYFIGGPFDDSHLFTAFVDPVGYVEFNEDGVRKNLPPTFFQASEPTRGPNWDNLATSLVQEYLEYRRTGSSPRMIRQMDPVFEEPTPEPEPPIERVSRYNRKPVI